MIVEAVNKVIPGTEVLDLAVRQDRRQKVVIEIKPKSDSDDRRIIRFTAFNGTYLAVNQTN